MPEVFQNETSALNESANLLKQSNIIKVEQQYRLKKRMDQRIYQEGDKDRQIYVKMLEEIASLEPYLSKTLDSEKGSERINSYLSFLPKGRYLPEVDDEIRKTLINSCIFEVMNEHAQQVGSSCCFCFYKVKPFVEAESKTIEKGEIYSARFFLGVESNFTDISCTDPTFTLDRKGRGKAFINFRPEINPSDSLPKKMTWSTRIHYLRDSIDLLKDFYVVNKCKN